MTFIQQCLNQYMADVQVRIAQVMRLKGVHVTGDAVASLSHSATQSGAGGKAVLVFKEYLRFVDIGVGRGNPLGGLKARRVALQASRQTGNVLGQKLRKKNPVYSKTAYGKLTWLQNKLLYGYTQETIDMLRLQLNPQTP